LTRSRRELEAARFLAEGGFFAQAVSRAYYAAFYAAQEGLQALGETRSKHSGVLAAFEKLVVREGGADPDSGRLLRSLFRRRSEADYRAAPASQKEADEATRDAERVVDVVESWLADRGR
jgi:uncharacterized protein (UPF0332 family)